MLLTLVFLIIFPQCNVFAWDTDDLELFDIVEEINKNFYKELGVPQDATSSEIRKAYRKLSLQLHPDKNKAEDAAIQFRQLVAMYEVLKDQKRREKYDQVLEFGLPDWRQPIYYYRKVRKLGLLEMTVILFIIFTVGHFIVIWTIYFEKRFELEEVFKSRKKKSKKGQKGKRQTEEEDSLLQEELNFVPRPQLRDILPIKCVKCLTEVLAAIPCMITSLKAKIEDWHQMCKKKQEIITSVPDEADAQEKVPRRRRIVVPGEMCKIEDPVSYIKEQSPIIVPTDSSSSHVKTGVWSSEDDHLLAKGVAKYPGGTMNRWEKIANYVSRPTEEVIKHAKSKFKVGSGSVSIASQGITGYHSDPIQIKKGKTITSDITTRSCNKKQYDEHCNDTDFENQADYTEKAQSSTGTGGHTIMEIKKNKTVSFTGATIFTSKVDTENKLFVNPQEIEKVGLLWSQNEQKIFEWAITHYPKGTAERWDRIAEHIPGKNKDECITRFKYLADLVKKKKKQNTSAENTTC